MFVALLLVEFCVWFVLVIDDWCSSFPFGHVYFVFYVSST